MEFTNAVCTSTATDDIKSEPMQLGKVEGSFFDASADDTTWEQENVWTMRVASRATLAAVKDTSRESVHRKAREKGKKAVWSKGGSKGWYKGKGGSKGGKDHESVTQGVAEGWQMWQGRRQGSSWRLPDTWRTPFRQ